MRIRTLRMAIVAGAFILGSLPLAAQDDAARLVATRVGADTVLLHVLGELPAGARIRVLRVRADGVDTLTPAPLRATSSPDALRGLLGAEYDALRRSLRVADEVELLRRITADAFSQTVIAAVSRGAAIALGRLAIDSAAPASGPVDYRAEVEAPGAPTRTLTARTAAAAAALATIPTPARLSSDVSPARIRLAWAASTAPPEREVGYHVYRRLGDGPEQRLTEMPVVRIEARAPFFEDVEVQEGARYRYTVRTVDLAGREGTASAPETLTVRDRTPPLAPQEVAVRREPDRVVIAWTPSTDLDVAGYHVERSAGLDRPFSRLTRVPVPAESLTWVDSTVATRVQHFWRVLAIDRSGNIGRPSSAASGFAEDTTPPAPPTAFTARPVQRRIAMNWGASPSRDVAGYHVYRGDDSSRIVRLTQQPIGGRAYVDSTVDGRGLRPGGRYVVRVTAVDSAMNESRPVEMSVTIPDDEPPLPATGLEVRNVEGRYFEISWSSSPSPDVQRYALTRRDSGATPVGGRRADSLFVGERSAASGAPWMVRDTSRLQPGRTYEYRVVAIDSAGNVGAPLAGFAALRDLTPPASVRFVAGRVEPAGVRLRWERVIDPALVGYHVYRSTLPTGTYERRTAQPITTLEFLDTGGDATWWYVVRAVDRSGNESAASRPVRGLP